MKNIELAQKIMSLFPTDSIYLVGGSSRDYLLTGDFKDFDFATPLTPNEVIFLLNVDTYDKFAYKFGTIKTKIFNQEVEITSFRKEENYTDSRHPNEVIFIADIKEDAKRRDFTINAIYLDKDLKVYDFYNGLTDLKSKTIRMIGNPYTRLKEDPLRIIRALRFSLSLGFNLDEDLEEAIFSLKDEIKKISSFRINSELNKMLKTNSKEEIETIFKKHNLEIDF